MTSLTPLCQKAISEVLAHEGGYTNNPKDRGGETNWGVTKAVAISHGYSGPMKDLPREKAVEIYAARYWDPLRLDDVAAACPSLAVAVFDAAVNSGPYWAAKTLQRLLTALNDGGRLYPDLTVDGNIGPATLAALEALRKARGADTDKVLAGAFRGVRCAFLLGLAEEKPPQETFLWGWLKRVI